MTEHRPLEPTFSEEQMADMAEMEQVAEAWEEEQQIRETQQVRALQEGFLAHTMLGDWETAQEGDDPELDRLFRELQEHLCKKLRTTAGFGPDLHPMKFAAVCEKAGVPRSLTYFGAAQALIEPLWLTGRLDRDDFPA